MINPRISWLPAIAAAVLAALPAAGQQQSDSETRRENQRLRSQVEDLERELEAARQRIEELERQIEDLRKAAAGSGQSGGAATTPAPEPPVSVDESVPNASPRALVAALVESYREAHGDLEMGQPDDRHRVAYMRALEKWASRVNRELKSQVDWHVRVVVAPWLDERDPRLELVAVDPETGTELGDPFPVQAARNVVRKMEQLESRAEAGVLRLKGVLLPNVRVNPARDTAGAFDRPRFIGPFAECELTVTVASVSEPEGDPEPERRPPQP